MNWGKTDIKKKMPNSCAVYIRESTASFAFAGVSPAQSLIRHPSGSQHHHHP